MLFFSSSPHPAPLKSSHVAGRRGWGWGGKQGFQRKPAEEDSEMGGEMRVEGAACWQPRLLAVAGCAQNQHKRMAGFRLEATRLARLQAKPRGADDRSPADGK